MQVSAAPAERRQGEGGGGGGGGTGGAGPAGGNSWDKTHQVQAVDSHCADRRILLYCKLNPADMKGGGPLTHQRLQVPELLHQTYKLSLKTKVLI